MTTNCIKFEIADIETAKGVGSISTLIFDIDIAVEPVISDNPMVPRTVFSAARREVAWLNATASGRSRTAIPVPTTS